MDDSTQFNVAEILSLLVDSKDISSDQASFMMQQILNNNLEEVQLAAFITLLRSKGETVEELTGLVNSMWDNMPDFDAPNIEMLDTCGTGGDNSNTFNISTAVALTLSAAGIPVAKHGNRAASSVCGAADVLEELSISINLSPQQCIERINETGFTFLFAPTFHPGMRFAGPVRKKLGVRTTFNFLGPLANPFKAQYRMHGVSDERIVNIYIETLKALGVKKAFVFTGHSGLDEISLSGVTNGKLLDNGEIKDHQVDPGEIDIALASVDALIGGDVVTNAEIIKDIAKGEESPRRDVVILNSAVALDMVTGIGMEEAAKTVREVISSGKLAEKIKQLSK